ncbi:MAG: ImmA/IrrE family metallo-endopeptidase, partial [Alphaproteobacteria bacterium]
MAGRTLVGHKIRRLRKQAGLTQVELAERLEISASYLNLIEHNHRPLTRPLLTRLGKIFGIDARTFIGDAEARVISDLEEVLNDPAFAAPGVTEAELAELTSTAPAIAQAIVTLYRAYRTAREDALMLSERLSDNPFLEESSHRLLTLLTSIRSFAEILRDNVGLTPERRQQYIGTVVEESEKLTNLINELFDFIGHDGLGRPRLADSPGEQVADFIQARANYFPELEEAAREVRTALDRGADRASAPSFDALTRWLRESRDVVTEIVPVGPEEGPLARFDTAGARLLLSEALPASSRRFKVARQIGLSHCAEAIEACLARADLDTPAARDMARTALGNYFAGALLMPYEDFHRAARTLRHDIERLQGRFDVSFEQACHRLA